MSALFRRLRADGSAAFGHFLAFFDFRRQVTFFGYAAINTASYYSRHHYGDMPTCFADNTIIAP